MKEKTKIVLNKIAYFFKNIGNFIKRIFLKVINKLRNINLQQKIIIFSSIIVFLLILALVTMFVKSKKLTNIEQIKLTEVSNNVITYIEEIDKTTDNAEQIGDRYISYALEYAYNENDKNELSIDEIITIIRKRFNVNLDEEKLSRIGITPYMLEKNITYDVEKNVYRIDKSSLTNADIANIPIYKYEITKMYRKNKNTYVVLYDKYIITNPYEILNYYTESNDLIGNKEYNIETKTYKENNNSKIVDTKPILNYLTGKEKIKTIKEYINSDNILEFGKKESQVTIIYIVKDGIILIDSIK